MYKIVLNEAKGLFDIYRIIGTTEIKIFEGVDTEGIEAILGSLKIEEKNIKIV